MINKIQIEEIELEKITSEWMDENYIRVQPYIVFRYNYFGSRYYIIKHDDDRVEYAPSVTSVIKRNAPTEYGLSEWKKNMTREDQDFISKNSANYGTFLHTLYNRLLLGDTLEFNNIDEELKWFCDNENEKGQDYNFSNIKKWMKDNKRDYRLDLFGFTKWVQDYKVVPLAIEYPGLYRDEDGILQAVGLMDLVCKLTLPTKNKQPAHEIIALIDYKSGRNWYQDFQIQLHIYRKMWNDMFPELQISRVFNLTTKNFRLPLGKTVTPYGFVDHTDSEDISMALWNNYHSRELLKGKRFSAVTEFKRDQDVKLNIGTKLNDLITSYNPLDKFTGFEYDKIKDKIPLKACENLIKLNDELIKQEKA